MIFANKRDSAKLQTQPVTRYRRILLIPAVVFPLKNEPLYSNWEKSLFVWTKINLCLYCSTEQAAFKWSDLQISMKCLAELGVVSNFTSWQSYLNWESVLKNFVKVTQFHLKYSCTFLRIFECLQVETPSALPSLITSLAINNYKLQIFQNIHGRNEPVESELFGCNNLSQFQAFLTLTTQLWAELSTNVKIFHFIFPFHV